MHFTPSAKQLIVVLGYIVLEFSFFPIAIAMPAILLRWLERRRSNLLDHCSTLYAAANALAYRDFPAALAALDEIERLETKWRRGERPTARRARWAAAIAGGFCVAFGVLIGAEFFELSMGAGQDERLSQHLLSDLLTRQALIYGSLTLLSSLSICYAVSSGIRQPPEIDFSEQLRKALDTVRA
jgi:hypothetical protein